MPIDRIERVRDARCATDGCWPGPSSSTADVPPFDRAAMDGYAVIAEDTFGAGRTQSPDAALHRDGPSPAACRRRAVDPASACEIATGAPMPEGATAVVMVEETERPSDGDVRVLTAGLSAPERRAPRGRHRAGHGRARARRGPQPEPHRRAGGNGDLRRRRLRAAGGRDSLDRRRDRRARPAARARADLRHQPLHAVRDRRAARRRPAVLCDRRGHARRSSTRRRTAPRPPTSSCSPAAARWARRDLMLDVAARARRGAVSRHRGEAGEADGCSAASVAQLVLGMPGYPTSCLSNAYLLLMPLLRRIARLPEYRPRTVHGSAGAPHRLDDGPASVLHRQARGRHRRAGVQGVGRHHQHVAGRRLHRDPDPHRHRRSGRAGGRQALSD